MKYLIATLLNEPAKSFNETLVKEVAKLFNVKEVIEKGAPAHITLKYSFETDKINKIEQILEKFSKEHNSCKYSLDGCGSFGKEVVFIEVKPDVEMIKLHQDFVSSLKKVKWLSWHPDFDAEKIHFHVSIAHGNLTKDNFDKIYNYVNSKEAKFDMTFDNISILKMESGIWKIYKIFKFHNRISD